MVLVPCPCPTSLAQDLRTGTAAFIRHQPDPLLCGVLLRISGRGSSQPCLNASRGGVLPPSWGSPSVVIVPIVREHIFSNEPKKPTSLSPQWVCSGTAYIPLLQDRLCVPPALPVREMESSLPGQRGGYHCPRLCSGGRELGKSQASLGRDVQVLLVFHLKWFLIRLAR